MTIELNSSSPENRRSYYCLSRQNFVSKRTSNSWYYLKTTTDGIYYKFSRVNEDEELPEMMNIPGSRIANVFTVTGRTDKGYRVRKMSWKKRQN